MAQVKVWNDNAHDYHEKFKDNDVRIPAKGFIEMEYYEAHEFKGTYRGVKRDADNQPLPASFKMIRVEEPAKGAAVDSKIDANKCVACSFVAPSSKALFDHTLASHAHQVVVDEELDKEIAATKAKRKTN